MIKLLPLLESKVPKFKNVPDNVKRWARYVAQHGNGEWWFYENPPEKVGTSPRMAGGWQNDGYQIASDVKTNPLGWDKTYYKLDVRNYD